LPLPLPFSFPFPFPLPGLANRAFPHSNVVTTANATPTRECDEQR
jgi:hypothetical protein